MGCLAGVSDAAAGLSLSYSGAAQCARSSVRGCRIAVVLAHGGSCLACSAFARRTSNCICGSYLWPCRGVEPVDHTALDHEHVGVTVALAFRLVAQLRGVPRSAEKTRGGGPVLSLPGTKIWLWSFQPLLGEARACGRDP